MARFAAGLYGVLLERLLSCDAPNCPSAPGRPLFHAIAVAAVLAIVVVLAVAAAAAVVVVAAGWEVVRQQ